MTQRRERVLKYAQNNISSRLPDDKRLGLMLASGTKEIIELSGTPFLMEGDTGVDQLKNLVSVMRDAETAWPARESDAGKQIEEALWTCRDSVILVRMVLEYAFERRPTEQRLLRDLFGLKMYECNQAILCVKANDGVCEVETLLNGDPNLFRLYQTPP